MTDMDPRIAAAYAFAWNVSNWPPALQPRLLGRAVPFEFMDRLLATVDAVDPLRQGDTMPVDCDVLRHIRDYLTEQDDKNGGYRDSIPGGLLSRLPNPDQEPQP